MPDELSSPSNPAPTSPLRKFLLLLLKIGITVVCFWYITTKIDFTNALRVLSRAHIPFILLSFLFFILSKLISSYRLSIYFNNINLHLPQTPQRKLYWLGMFYNLFLPGAISGDAYKVVLLNRRYGVPYKKASAAVLLDRFSGVLALGLIGCVYGIFVLPIPLVDFVLGAGAIAAIGLFYLITRFLFKDFLPGFWPALFWGFLVQASQVLCIYGLLLSLDIPVLTHQWIFIFLVSAVVSVLPISLGGGLGTREFVFAEGASYFHLNPQTGVVISLLFYLLTVAGSLPGLYFMFHDPLPAELPEGFGYKNEK